MPGLGQLFSQWGSFAIFLFVIPSNIRLPTRGKSIFVLAGYLTWKQSFDSSLFSRTNRGDATV